MLEMTIPSNAQEIIDDLNCSCEDCIKYFSNFLGAAVNEATFCELKHIMLLADTSSSQQEFNDALDKQNLKCCQSLSNSLNITISPICLSHKDAMKTPLDIKFLFDKITFKECVAFESNYLVTVFTRKLAYAMNIALTGLSLHNPMDQIEDKIKELVVIIAATLNTRLQQLDKPDKNKTHSVKEEIDP